MSIEQKWCEVQIFQLQSMLNMIRCINQRFVFKNSDISCLALIFKLKNPSTTVLYSKKSVAGGLIYSFFQAIDTKLQTYGLVVKNCSTESVDMGLIPDEC